MKEFANIRLNEGHLKAQALIQLQTKAYRHTVTQKWSQSTKYTRAKSNRYIFLIPDSSDQFCLCGSCIYNPC